MPSKSNIANEPPSMTTAINHHIIVIAPSITPTIEQIQPALSIPYPLYIDGFSLYAFLPLFPNTKPTIPVTNPANKQPNTKDAIPSTNVATA